MRVKAFMAAHIIKETDNDLFLISKDMNVAIPNEFEAWLDVKPYFPALVSLTTSTAYMRNGSFVGRHLSKKGLQNPEDI